jgi:hypothetical protein
MFWNLVTGAVIGTAVAGLARALTGKSHRGDPASGQGAEPEKTAR